MWRRGLKTCICLKCGSSTPKFSGSIPPQKKKKKDLIKHQKREKEKPEVVGSSLTPLLSGDSSLSLPPPACRMASPLWRWLYSRAMTRWSPCCWRTIQRARCACLPCTSLPARMTPRPRPCSCRTTTTRTSSPRWATGFSLWSFDCSFDAFFFLGFRFFSCCLFLLFLLSSVEIVFSMLVLAERGTEQHFVWKTIRLEFENNFLKLKSDHP